MSKYDRSNYDPISYLRWLQEPSFWAQAKGTLKNNAGNIIQGIGTALNKGVHNKVGDGLALGAQVANQIPGFGWMIGAALSTGSMIANGLTDEVNSDYEKSIAGLIGNVANTTSGASNYKELQADYTQATSNSVNLGSLDNWGQEGFLTSAFGSSKRKAARDKARESLEIANNTRTGNLNTRGLAINLNNTNQQLANLRAFGGAVDFMLASNNTNLNMNNGSLLTLYNGFVPLTTFDNGGNLHTHGTDWSNGLTFFNAGGTHELNPNMGILLGIAPDGLPNLVEEGEVKFNDYIYSNRLTLDKDMLEKYNLSKDTTYAEAVKKLSKESEERPNDPISLNGLNAMLLDMQESLEMVRLKKQAALLKRLIAKMSPEELAAFAQLMQGLYACGGHLHNNGDWLRYAPVVGSAIGAINSLFSKPDTAAVDEIRNAASLAGSYTPVSYNPIGEYMSYNPLDINYTLNLLRGSELANARNIMNNSNGNAGVMLAGLLANAYNSLITLGKALREAQEANIALLERVKTFNRATDMTNSQGELQAASTNALSLANAIARLALYLTTAALLNQTLNLLLDALRGVNLTNLFDNLGAVGKGNDQRKLLAALAEAGVFGMLTPKLKDILGIKKCGGKIHKKKGLTY